MLKSTIESISIKGLEHFTSEELTSEILYFIFEKVNYVEDDFKITRLCIVGSRVKGTERFNSDLDVAFQYTGRYREDSMCDTLNMYPLFIDDFKIDFIPYAEYKGSHIDESLPLCELPLLI